MVERVLAIFAHPDDECLVAGGTLAAYAAAGAEVGLICMTCGEAGPITPGINATRETLAVVRRSELLKAAQILGISDVECLDYPDGDLSSMDTGDVAADLARHIADRRPHIIITFGPEGLYWHPDHIAVHRFVLDALQHLASADRGPQLHYATWPDGLAQQLLSAMRERGLTSSLWSIDPAAFGASPSSIGTVVDVRAFVPVKLEAFRRHESQLGPDNVFRLVPDDLALDLLGHEYFMT
jgi:LmbE family N-acetylglucosaminyl deacetylase